MAPASAGHSDLPFTERVYVHPEARSLMAGSEQLAELLGRTVIHGTL
ncbi:hypothetical protein GXW82_31925 [Streptacidiphilus sp. 4-A2]|nr:hypothetical protein [Streptacidiphilus sp. 4-A2]